MDGQALAARSAVLGQALQRRAHETLASLEAFARSVGQGLETADFAKPRRSSGSW